LSENPHDRFSRNARAALALAVGLYAAARLWRLTSSCLWFDEIFSLHAARHEWGAMLRFAAADIIHPPLFYALLKLWTAAGGESLLWLRLLPALLSIAAIIPLVLLCRELRLRPWETNLAVLLAGTSGYLIKYAQELRMYSLLMLLTLFSLWLFARLTNAARPRDRFTLPALFAVNLLLVYTHYYGWLVVAAQLAYLLFARRRLLTSFAGVVALLALCYAPWLLALARSRPEQGAGVGQNLGWASRPGALDFVDFFAIVHEPFYFRQSMNEPAYQRWGAWMALLVFLLPLALLAWRVWKERRGGGAAVEVERGPLVFLLFFMLVPALLAFALSWALPFPVWGMRHLVVAAAPYLVLAAAALARVRPAWMRATLLVLMSCWMSWGAYDAWARGDGRYIWCGWEGLAAEMRRMEPADSRGVPVYAFEDLVAYHLWFDLSSARDERFDVRVIKGAPGLAEDPAYFLPRAFGGVTVVQFADASAFEGERLWVAFRDVRWDESRPPLKLLRERGYRFGELREFRAQGQRAFVAEVRR
jgi:hypothetical protein